MEILSEEEIIDIIKDFLELKEIHSNNDIRKSILSVYQEAIEGLLDLYNNTKESELLLANKFQKANIELNKEKEKNKAIEIYRKDMPDDTELIIMRKDDFDRNFGSDYISKDKIREKIEECNKLRQKAENSEIYTRMVDYMDILQELLEERN